MSNKNETTIELVHDLAEKGFWGSLTLKFEAGRVVHLKKEESLIPERLTEKPRYDKPISPKGNS